MYHLAKYAKEVDIEGILLGENDHEHHHEPDQEGRVGHRKLDHLPADRSEQKTINQVVLMPEYIHLYIWTYLPNIGTLPIMTSISIQTRKEAMQAK